MRWIVRLFGLVVVLIGVALGALMLLPTERIAAIATDQVKAQTGRDLTISGDLSLSFWPVLGVRTGPVTLSNAEWVADGPMVSAQEVAIGVDAAALLGGEIRVTHIEAVAPVVRLATRADGTGNWVFGAPSERTSAAGPAQASAPPVTVARLRISDAEVIYAAHGAEPVRLTGLSASVDWPDPAGAATIAAGLTLAAEPIEVEGGIDRFGAFLSGEISELALELRTNGGRLGFDGRASLQPEAAGVLQFSTVDSGQFLASLGVPDVTVPAGLGRALEGQADLTFTGGTQLALRGLSLGLDQNQITGAADLELSTVPRLTAQLTAGALDLSALGAGSQTGGQSESPASSGWSTDPIDASALGALNAGISLTANSVDLGSIKLGATDIGITVEDARAVLALRGVQVFGGAVTGELVANNRNGLSVGGALQASGIALEQALSDLAGISRLAGVAEVETRFLGVGQSVDAIVNSLSGSGSLSTGQGVFTGFDLDRLMRSGDGGGGTTVFDSLSASYRMENGSLFNEDLLLLLANFRAEGAGRIGLGAQDLDYIFTPIALRANSGQGLAIPVRITGPWAAPRILPDLGAALQLDMDGRVDEITESAREQVQDKIEEELGVIRQEGQSTEDAIKDALEGRAKNKLLDLLGGN